MVELCEACVVPSKLQSTAETYNISLTHFYFWLNLKRSNTNKWKQPGPQTIITEFSALQWTWTTLLFLKCVKIYEEICASYNMATLIHSQTPVLHTLIQVLLLLLDSGSNIQFSFVVLLSLNMGSYFYSLLTDLYFTKT